MKAVTELTKALWVERSKTLEKNLFAVLFHHIYLYYHNFSLENFFLQV